jgi:hypothetical protein
MMTPWAYLFIGAACIAVVDASVGLRPLAYHERTIIATFAPRNERNDTSQSISLFHERQRLQDVLSARLRGGAVTTTAPSDLWSVLIQPEILASAGALFYTVQGACIFLSPERFCNALGMPNFCVGRLLMRILGNTMLHSGILMTCFHVWHVDIATAIAISSIVFLVESLTEFLNGEPKKIGYKATFPALNFLVHFCIMVLGFCDSYLLAEILPFYAGYIISVSAIPMILVPRLWTRQVGFDIVDSKELHCVQAIGWLLANSG